ncbi:MAG TPA: hypothetical protein DCS66_14750 [Flavobacteriaceae bacterium]|nr:hypothetical protein [Flavobacteriaceae bacterium]
MNEELDKKIQETLDLKQELTLRERMEYLFEEIDNVCHDLDKRSLEFMEQLDKMSNEQILDYYSRYNLNKRVLRHLCQANTSIMQYLQPEIFKDAAEAKKGNLLRCLKCGVNLTEQEVPYRKCVGCFNTAE